MNNDFELIVNFNNPWVASKTIQVPHVKGITVHRALEVAYDLVHSQDKEFNFDLRWSGSALGYFVQALCNVPTTLSTSWEIFYNGAPATEGIDKEIAGPGVAVEFRYVLDKDISSSAHLSAKRAAYNI